MSPKEEEIILTSKSEKGYHAAEKEALMRSGRAKSGEQALTILAARRLDKMRVKEKEKWEKFATTDFLTRLTNRQGFFTLGEVYLKLADRNGRRVLLLFADLDQLKWINDTLGHKVGDQALIEVSDILKKTFRESDVVARIGGDEFGVLAIPTDQGDDTKSVSPEEAITARLNEKFKAFNAEGDRPYKLSLSLGVIWRELNDPRSLEELMAKADELMYKQKRGDKERN